MQQHRSNSYLFGGNAPYVEELYEAYLDNPGSVPDNWRTYFDNLQNVPAADGTDAATWPTRRSSNPSPQRAKANAFAVKASAADLAVARKQVHVQSLIAAYRFLGSRWADLDPLKRTERPKIPELEPAFYDLTESDMDITFSAANTYFGRPSSMTLREIVQALRETYCGSIGAEFMHCTDPTEKRWWQERLESIRSKPTFSADEEEAHPRPPDRRRGPGALPAHQVRRPEALLARRRRELHRLDGRTGAARRREGRAGDRHRHGPPRPPERAGQHPGQDAGGPVRRVRPHRAGRPAGAATSSTTRASRATCSTPRRPGAPVAGVQPVAPGDRQPGGRGLGQGAHGPPRRQATATRCCRSWCTATPPSPARAS